jgi:hypothetical protein
MAKSGGRAHGHTDGEEGGDVQGRGRAMEMRMRRPVSVWP